LSQYIKRVTRIMQMESIDRHALSGTWLGHIIPAIGFTIISSCTLSAYLRRSCNSSLHTSFPEQNTKFLNFSGVSVCICCVIGVIGEGISSVHAGKDDYGFFGPIAHFSMYYSFFLVGCMAILESKGKVAPDTHRKIAVVAFLIEYQVFAFHAAEQPGSFGAAHSILSTLALVTAFTFAYAVILASPINNTNEHAAAAAAEMGILAIVLLLIQAGWFYIFCILFFKPETWFTNKHGFNEDLPLKHRIAPYFGIEVTMVIGFCYTIALIVGQYSNKIATDKNAPELYNKVLVQDDDNDDNALIIT